MSVYFRVLFLPLIVFPFLINPALAGTTSVERPPSYNSEWLETQSIPHVAATLSSVSVSLVSEPNLDTAPMSSKYLSNKEKITEIRLRNPGKVSRFSLVCKGIFSLHLLFLVALAVAGSKTLAAQNPSLLPEGAEGVAGIQKEEEGQVKDEEFSSVHPPEVFAAEERVAKTRARIEKVKNLLPAAYRLASAVDSEASWQLLESVQMAVKEAGEVKEEAKDFNIIKISLFDALSALNELHKAAFQRAEELAAAAKSLPSFPPLSQGDEASFELFSKSEKETELQVMDVLLHTYNSLEGDAATLAQQRQEGEKIIHSLQLFKNEKDKKLLVKTAKALEFLRETGKSRCRLITAANRLNKIIFSGFRTVLLGDYNEFIRETESRLQAVELHAAMWKGEIINKNSKEAFSVHKNNTPTLYEQLKEETTKINYFLKELLSLRHSMLESTNIADICAAYTKAKKIEKDAFLSLEKSSSIAVFLASHREDLDHEDSHLLIKKGEEAVHSLILESSVLSQTMGELRVAAAGLSKGADGAPLFSKVLIKEHLDIINKIETNAKARVSASENSLEALKKARQMSLAMGEISALNAHRKTQEKDKKIIELLKLRSGFLAFLKEDAEKTLYEVLSVVKKVSVAEILKYKALGDQFSAATMKFEKATNIEEAAKAVKEMRRHASVLRERFLMPQEERLEH